MPAPQPVKLLDAKTATGAGDAFPMTPSLPTTGSHKTTFQGVVVGTGAVSATIDVDVSNDGTYWLVAGTLTLSGTTSDQAGLTLDAPWVWVRGNITALSGTGAAVTLTKGA